MISLELLIFVHYFSSYVFWFVSDSSEIEEILPLSITDGMQDRNRNKILYAYAIWDNIFFITSKIKFKETNAGVCSTKCQFGMRAVKVEFLPYN